MISKIVASFSIPDFKKLLNIIQRFQDSKYVRGTGVKGIFLFSFSLLMTVFYPIFLFLHPFFCLLHFLPSYRHSSPFTQLIFILKQLKCYEATYRYVCVYNYFIFSQFLCFFFSESSVSPFLFRLFSIQGKRVKEHMKKIFVYLRSYLKLLCLALLKMTPLLWRRLLSGRKIPTYLLCNC